MKRVEVQSGSRLHFGLLRPTTVGDRAYGGAGMMIEQPSLLVRVDSADDPTPQETQIPEIQHRVETLLARWNSSRATDDTSMLPCRLSALRVPALHTGLGIGTQLALSATLALSAWYHEDLSIPQCAAIAGRGRRSAVGTYGFFTGGFILDGGSTPTSELGELVARYNTPDAWRIVLATPPLQADRVQGGEEDQRFARCPLPEPATVDQLEQLLRGEVAPAIEASEFDDFASAVTRYNHDAGLLFEAVQGGAYHGAEITQLVARIQSLGTFGVGQSSWGPTVFAICRDETHAAWLVDHIRSDVSRVQIARPLNRPAHLQ